MKFKAKSKKESRTKTFFDWIKGIKMLLTHLLTWKLKDTVSNKSSLISDHKPTSWLEQIGSVEDDQNSMNQAYTWKSFTNFWSSQLEYGNMSRRLSWEYQQKLIFKSSTLRKDLIISYISRSTLGTKDEIIDFPW